MSAAAACRMPKRSDLSLGAEGRLGWIAGQLDEVPREVGIGAQDNAELLTPAPVVALRWLVERLPPFSIDDDRRHAAEHPRLDFLQRFLERRTPPDHAGLRGLPRRGVSVRAFRLLRVLRAMSRSRVIRAVRSVSGTTPISSSTPA